TLVFLKGPSRTRVTATLSGANAADSTALPTTRDAATPADSIKVSFAPQLADSSRALLTLTYDDGSTLTVHLLGTGLPDPVATLAAVDVRIRDTIGATVRVPIIVRHDRQLAAIDFRMMFDTSVLIFDRFALASD